MAMKCHELHHFQLRRFAASPRPFSPDRCWRAECTASCPHWSVPANPCWTAEWLLAGWPGSVTYTQKRSFSKEIGSTPRFDHFDGESDDQRDFWDPIFYVFSDKPEDHLALFHVQLGHNSSWPWLHHSGFLAWKWQTKVKPSPNLGLWKSLAWNLPNDLW